MLSTNEGKVCDAIVQYLEERHNARRSNLELHDHNPNYDARIEISVNIGLRLYAIEHTIIEPFADFLKLNAQAPRFIDPIKQVLASKLDQSTTYHLHMPALAHQNVPRRDIPKVQAQLAAHVLTVGPTLPISKPGRYTRNVQPIRLPDVPFEVKLYRQQPYAPGCGRFEVVHGISGDERERAARIQVACDKKFPKLDKWKRQKGARSILILEDNDIQNTNEILVADAYLPIARSRADRPDETYMVGTFGGDEWWVTPLLIDDYSLFDIDDMLGGGASWFVKSGTLTPLTTR